MSVFSSDRNFQLWEYRVSHGGLLIRSPKGPKGPKTPEERTNVDLVFDGVEYVACPRFMDGLELASASSEDLIRLPEVIKPVELPDQVFVLVSGGERYLIVAGSCRVDEHAADIFESPFT